MSRARKSHKVEVVRESPASGHSIRRFLITVSILAAVLYVSLYLACRTDGFRSYAEDFLESHMGIPVHVKRIESTLGLDLILSGVMTEDISRKGVPGYRVREAVVRWSVLNRALSRGGILSGLELNDCSVSFAPGESGGWEPAAFAKLGSWLADWGRFGLKEQPSRAAPVSPEQPDQEVARPSHKVKADYWDRINLRIRNGDVSWWDADKRELASAEGIRFDVTPLSVPNRRMTHYFLTLDGATIGEQRGVRDFTFEMLKMESNNIVITCVGDWGGAAGEKAGSAPQE